MSDIKNTNIIFFVLLYCLYLSLIHLFSLVNLGPLSSFLTFFLVTLTYIIIAFPLAFISIFKSDYKSITLVLSIIFVSRVLLGFFHQIIFFGVDYFQDPSNFIGIYEAEWMHNLLIKYSDPNSELAPFFSFSIMSEDGIMRDKSAELHFYNSIIYKSFGNYSYNIIIWNSLHIMLISAFLSFIALSLTKSNIIAFRTLVLSAFYPNGLFTNMMYRDITGLAFLCFGCLIFIISSQKGTIQFVLSILVFCVCGYLLREPYFALIFVTCCFIGLKKVSKENPITLGFVILLGSIILILSVYTIIQISFFRYSVGDSPVAFGAYQLIKNIKIFILGPFPFYQFFTKVHGFEFQAQHYPLIIYNWIIFYIIFTNIRQILKTKLSSLFFISMGFLTSLVLFSAHLHIDYMVPGIIFLIPIIANFKFPIKTLLLFSTIIYLSLNLFYFIFSMILTGNPFMGIFS